MEEVETTYLGFRLQFSAVDKRGAEFLNRQRGAQESTTDDTSLGIFNKRRHR